MKKSIILLMSVFCFAIIVPGCKLDSLAMPEKVYVETDATYNFNLANLDSSKNSKFDLSEYFDIQKLLTQEDENSQSQSGDPEVNFDVYKYNDGSSDFQQLLLHMPIKEIEFDFSSSFGDMDISKSVKSFNIDKEFEIPSVDGLNQTQPVDLTSIEEALNTAVTFTGYTDPDDLTVHFNGNTFEGVVYNSGYFVIDANPTILNPTGGDVYGSVDMLDAWGQVIASADFENSIAALNISGKELTYTGMKLRYYGYDYGVTFVATIADDSKIKIARGVTIDSSVYTPPTADVTFPIDIGEKLGTVTIEEGTLSVVLSTPDTWSPDVIDDYTIYISGSINCTPITKANPEASLNNKELTSGDINATAEVSIILDDATIDFDNPPTVTVTTEVKTISAAVKMDDSFKTSIDEPTEIPKDLSDYVEKIEWNKVGFNVKAKNNLPEGNDIDLKISSDFFGIPAGTAQTIKAGLKDEQGNYKEQTLSFINDTPSYETVIVENGTMDIKGDIILNTDSDGNLVVSHVAPGQTYNISLEVEPVFDWHTAYVKMPDSANYSDQMDTGINKKALFDSLGEDVAQKINDIKMSSLPLYIFANMPDFFKNTSGFSGKIDYYYATQEQGQAPVIDGQKKNLYGDDPNDKFNFESMPVLVKNDKDEVTNDFGNPLMDFSEALNETTNNKEATLFLDYSIGIGGSGSSVPITSTELESLKAQGKSSIKIDVVLILNLNFILDDSITINLQELMDKSDDQNSSSGSTTAKTDKERDLFGRSGPTVEDSDDYLQFLDIVKSANLTVSKVKFPITGEMELAIDWDPNDGVEPQKVSFGDGQKTNIKLEGKSAPSELIKKYPLEPTIDIVIKQGNFGLKRDVSVGGKISVGLKAKGKIKVFDSENQDSFNFGGNE